MSARLTPTESKISSDAQVVLLASHASLESQAAVRRACAGAGPVAAARRRASWNHPQSFTELRTLIAGAIASFEPQRLGRPLTPFAQERQMLEATPIGRTLIRDGSHHQGVIARIWTHVRRLAKDHRYPPEPEGRIDTPQARSILDRLAEWTHEMEESEATATVVELLQADQPPPSADAAPSRPATVDGQPANGQPANGQPADDRKAELVASRVDMNQLSEQQTGSAAQPQSIDCCDVRLPSADELPEHGWSFGLGWVAYGQRPFRLHGQKVRLLETLAEAKGRSVSILTLKEVAGDPRMETKSLRGSICKLRTAVRTGLSLARDKDPIPDVDGRGYAIAIS
jgi:hypothetical protein